MKRHRKRRSTAASQPATRRNRATDPMISWLHGMAAMGDERWDEAIAALNHCLDLESHPEDRAKAYQNLGASYLALERFDEALAALDAAERSIPHDPQVMHSRGVVYACAGRLGEAIATFEEFARRWPRPARQHETQKAIRLLRRAQRGEISPGSYLLDHLQEQVSNNLKTGDFHLVERKARRMIAADPTRPEGHFALGLACVQQGRYPEALEAFLAAQARDPDYAPTLYNIGHTLLQMDQLEQTIPWLERALHQDPGHMATLHQLGVAYERLGRRDEAVAWWRRALQKDPNYDLAQQRLHEVGQGPAPAEPPLSPQGLQLRAMTPVVKARMRRPQVHCHGGITLTYDGEVGFVLEDTENPFNATIHAGGPFKIAHITDDDLLDLIGLVKLLLHMINTENTRDVAVLAYYTGRLHFGYRVRFERGKQIELDAHGQFVVAEVPRFFKLRIDSDLVTPYGDPMQGTLIYLNQDPEPSILVSTLGLLPKQRHQ